MRKMKGLLSVFASYVIVCALVHGNAIVKSKQPKNISNLTKALPQTTRSDRQIVEDEESYDDFPVVHDYFFETDEGYPGEGGRDYSDEFQPLCHNVRRRIELKSDVYDYFPPHYVETVCRKFSPSGVDIGEFSRNTHTEMCSEPGFRCVQRTQTLYVTRRRYDSDCWETTKEKIASGCDCMWPGRSLRIKNN